MTARRFAPIALALCLALAAAAPCLAGEPTEQLRSAVDRVVEVLNDRELRKPEKREERRLAIRRAVEERYDFREMAGRALALHWRQRTPEEKDEFTRLFRDLIEETYVRKIERYEDEQVLYGDETVDGGYAEVRTTISSGQNQIPVDYRMHKTDAGWLVYDVVIEGVSLVNNYRTQFKSIIASGSYEKLLQRIRDKVDKLRREA